MGRTFWLTVLLLWGIAAHAAPDGQVEAVTMPAWLVRDGLRAPLVPGAQLRAGDAIATGAAARARLRLADGSIIKLGERARFALPEMTYEPGSQLLRATLGVVEGAFRFTTAQLDRFRGKREVQVQFTTFTIGLRGTDVWGRSATDQEFVVLIEGRIEVARPGHPAVLMDSAKTWYRSPRNAPPLAVEPIPDELLGRFAAETEIAPGQGTIGEGGSWRLIVLRAADKSAAIAAHDRLREAGYPATLERLWLRPGRHRVQIEGFENAAEAAGAGARLRTELGFDATEVAR